MKLQHFKYGVINWHLLILLFLHLHDWQKWLWLSEGICSHRIDNSHRIQNRRHELSCNYTGLLSRSHIHIWSFLIHNQEQQTQLTVEGLAPAFWQLNFPSSRTLGDWEPADLLTENFSKWQLGNELSRHVAEKLNLWEEEFLIREPSSIYDWPSYLSIHDNAELSCSFHCDNPSMMRWRQLIDEQQSGCSVWCSQEC